MTARTAYFLVLACVVAAAGCLKRRWPTTHLLFGDAQVQKYVVKENGLTVALEADDTWHQDHAWLRVDVSKSKRQTLIFNTAKLQLVPQRDRGRYALELQGAEKYPGDRKLIINYAENPRLPIIGVGPQSTGARVSFRIVMRQDPRYFFNRMDPREVLTLKFQDAFALNNGPVQLAPVELGPRDDKSLDR